MPLHIMLNIAKFEGSIQSIVNISQCQKSMRRGLQNYRLDLSVHAFTQQQIEAAARFFQIIGVDLTTAAAAASSTAATNESLFQCCPNLETVVGSNTDINLNLFRHTPKIQHIDLPGGNITGDIAVFQHCPELRLINCRESKKVVGDIMHLQNCSNLTSFAMLRTRVAGNARVVREHLHNLVKFDCQSTQITGKTSDFRFCTNL